MFSDDRDPGLDVTSAALAAMDRFGVSEAFEFPHLVIDLAIDEAAILWAIEKASTLGDTSNAFHFLRWVCKRAPVALLRQNLPEIESIPAGKFEAFPRLITRARQRLEFHEMPVQECISRLHEVLGRCQEGDDFPHDLIDEARVLCQRLVAGREAHSELERLTIEWLSFDFGEEPSPRDWFSGIAIELAGMLRLQSTIHRLIEHFDHDWDWWNESIQKSIGRMRSLETLELCAAIYPNLEWHGRLFLADVFESPRIPEIEPSLSKLLKDEPADDLRVNLACALALLGTPSSQSAARAVYRECRDDPERFVIAETLYSQFVIQGIDDPDLKRWRTKMERSRQMYSQLLSPVTLLENVDLTRSFGIPSAGQGCGGEGGVQESPLSEVQSAPSVSSDIVPAKFSAGRNDPCPCGSGKKFKKCCLKL